MALNKIERRARIKMRIRKIVNGTPSQPRMTVFRSNKQIYVQFIDDLAGVTLATASSLDKEVAAEAAGKNKLWTGWISLLSKGLLRVFSNTTVQKHQFFGTQLSL